MDNNLFPHNESDLNEQEEVLREEARIESLMDYHQRWSSAMLDNSENVIIDGVFEGKLWVIDYSGHEIGLEDTNRLYQPS